MLKFVLFSTLLIFIFTAALYAQNDQIPSNANSAASPAPQATPAQTNPNDTILKYEQFLRDETKLHREYTQQYYTNLLILIGAMGTILGAVLAWLNWKSKDDIRKEVEQKFKENVESLLNEKFKQVDNLVTESKEKSALQFEEINKLLFELSTKSKEISARQPMEAPTLAPDPENLKDRRILWVDDHPKNIKYPQTILEQAGVKFSLASSTEEAIRQLSEQHFDLIISDMVRATNREAGLDLLNELHIRDLPVPVIISASTSSIKRSGERAIELGAKAVTSNSTGLLSEVYRILTSK